MKTLKYILALLLTISILGIIGAGIFIRSISRKGIPDYNKDTRLNGLSSEVIVLRDSLAVPHIYASNEEDLYRATGYVMAQDRLWQMDLLRRLTTGRLSEIFGKNLVQADLLFRALEFSEKSEIVIDSAGQEVEKYLEAFADGVNLYINERGSKLPPEFTILGYKPEPWTTVHSANLIGYMSWSLTMAWDIESVLFKISQVVDEKKLIEMIPDMGLQNKAVYPSFRGLQNSVELESALNDVNRLISEWGLQVFKASNNWAVSGEKSVTGMPLMANDMHLDLNAPGIWYQVHQVVEGKLNVTGVAVPGQPFIVCGHNDSIAWGMTNVMLDEMDFYIETLDTEDTLKYLYDGKWMEMKVKKEIVNTKEGISVTGYNRFTHRGPVISSFKGINDHVISMRWIGKEYSNELLSVYKFNHAKNWEEFREAARGFIAIAQNVVYSDKNGNIGLQTAAGVPVRKGNPALFYPGDTSLYEWEGIIPFEELPFSYNPACGFVASANNRTVDSLYPYYISYWYDLPNRYEVITKILSSGEKFDIAGFAEIQRNQTSFYAAKLTPVFLSALNEFKDNMDNIEKQSYTYLSEWDYNMPVTSIASSIFEVMYIELIKAIFYDELGDDIYKALIKQDLLPTYLIDGLRVKGQSLWTDNINTIEKQETFNDNIIEAFHNAINWLKENAGRDPGDWKWGDLHTLTLKHPLGSVRLLANVFKLNYGPSPVGGSYHTVSPYSYPFENPFEANHGASHRHIYSTKNWDDSWVVIPTGISGIPASQHYCDQTLNYIRYIYHFDKFSREAVNKAVKYRMVLKSE